MKKRNLIIRIVATLLIVAGIIFLIIDVSSAKKKARIIAEETVNEKGLYLALSEIPYTVSSEIYLDISSNKYTEKELREVIVERYTEAEATYHDKSFRNIFFIIPLCFLLAFVWVPKEQKKVAAG
jgi:hypothetical protein